MQVLYQLSYGPVNVFRARGLDRLTWQILHRSQLQT